MSCHGVIPEEHWLGPITCIMEWADGEAWVCQWGATDFIGDAHADTSTWINEGGWTWTGETWPEIWDDTPVTVSRLVRHARV